MSKFTKALERIQEQKEIRKTPLERTEPNGALSEKPEKSEERIRYWEDGIATIRNAKPEARIVAHRFPHSLISEQYRMLRTNLKTHLEKEGGKVFTVSSSLHDEGKTTTIINLAISLAEMGESRVALIDGDLRRGKIAEYLGLGKDLPGLSNLLEGGLSLHQVVVRNSLKNLFIMPRGRVIKNASELFTSQKFRDLVKELRRYFDYILIDAPPILSVVDANLMARETDGLLMVIQSRRTPKTVMAQAHDLFLQAGVKLIGYVLTNVEYQSPDTRYYYHQYYDAEPGSKRGRIRGKYRVGAKLAEQRFLGLEQKFNHWWGKKVLKK